MFEKIIKTDIEYIQLKQQHECIHEIFLLQGHDLDEETFELIKEYDSDIKSMLDEIHLLQKENDELNQIYIDAQMKNTKQKRRLELEIDAIKACDNTYAQLEKEFKEINQSIEMSCELNKLKSEHQEHNLKHLTHETRMSILDNDFKIISRIDKEKGKIIEISDKYLSNSKLYDISFKHFSAIELLTGIKIVEKALHAQPTSTDSDNNKMALSSNANIKNILSYYNILFLYLLDECLNPENSSIKSVVSKLSSELMDKYQSVFKKRKQQRGFDSRKSGNCVFLNNLNDYQVIYDNYIDLICFLLTKHEIEEAKNKFAVDWIEGSSVITILINSKSSKMATIVLPKYYPLSGTSCIRLISLSGYDNSMFKNFQIELNLDSLTQWIFMFTEMYNKNELK